MRIARLFLITIFLFFSLNSFANPNSHSHAGRAHSHPLPAQGIKHKHGNGQIGSSRNTQKPIPKNNVIKRPKIVDRNGDTPLIKASWRGKLQEVKTHIKNGAVINHQDHAGQTALHLATTYGHFEIVKELINAGADLNLQKKSGSTALSLATLNKRHNIANYLRQKGARASSTKPKPKPRIVNQSVTKEEKSVTALKKVNYTGIRAQVVARLKKDKKIPPAFIDTIPMDFGNGVLIIYNNCKAHEQLNNERIKLEYTRKERIRKVQQEQNRRRRVYDPMATLRAINDNPFKKSFAFKSECRGMIRRISTLAKTVNGIKEVEILEQ